MIVYSVHSLRLTERFTVGNALLAGVTFGTNTKTSPPNSTCSTRPTSATRRAAGTNVSGFGGCGLHSMYMTTDFPFPEVVKSQEKAKQLWDEASVKTVELCAKHLGNLAESERKLAKQ